MIPDAPQPQWEPPEVTDSFREIAVVLRAEFRTRRRWLDLHEIAAILGHPESAEIPDAVMEALWYLEDVGLVQRVGARFAISERTRLL